MALSVSLWGALWLTCASAHADKVHLVGGSVIEGKVERLAGKIVIALDSGEVRIPAASVVRIEPSESPYERIAAQRAALPKGAVAERLALANDCRDDRQPQCERELLQEILTIEPDHAEARARLGYVRSERGWITRREQQRAQASSEPPRDEAAVTRRAELQRETAELARRQAELELEAQRLLLRNAELSRRQSELRDNSNLWFTPYVYAVRPPLLLPPPRLTAPAFGINGVRAPESYFR